MNSKQVIGIAFIIIVDAILAIFLFLAMIFAIVSPQRMQEVLTTNPLSYYLKKILFRIILSLVASVIVTIMCSLANRWLRIYSVPVKRVAARHFLFFLIVTAVGLIVDYYWK